MSRQKNEESGERSESSPYVEVKGDVRFDPQLVLLGWLKYTVVCSIKVLEQLTVEKPKSTAERNTCKVLQIGQ